MLKIKSIISPQPLELVTSSFDMLYMVQFWVKNDFGATVWPLGFSFFFFRRPTRIEVWDWLWEAASMHNPQPEKICINDIWNETLPEQ